MKIYIHSILLLTLCLLLTGVAWSQTTSLRRVRIESATGAAGTPYEVLALRNLTTYPITVSGTKSWTTAVATGQISLTVLGTGCVIAQGTAPPPIPPTCTVTPPVATTQVITIAAYSQTQNGPENRFIYTAASGSSPTSTELTFSGAPIAASNYAFSLVYQTNEGSNPGQGAIRVNGGGSDQATFNLEVASGGTRTVTGTLNLAMGNNTIAFTLNTGSLPYQVRSLSISRTSSTTTVVTGGTSTTTSSGTTTTPTTTTNLTAQGLNADFTAPADQGWNILTTREKYIETSALKIGFLRGGAVISYGALKRDNRNLVNSNQVYYTDKSSDFRYNTFTDDLGRQIMFFSDYMSPGPNDNAGQGFILKNGKKTSTGYGGYVFNTGANTVQGGSLFPALDFSPILSSATYVHPQRGTEFYAKTRAQIWGLGQEAGWVVGEQWCSFPLPNCLFCFTRRTVEVRDAARFAEQRNFDSQSQENPCLYLIAPLTQKLIDLPGESRKNIYNGIADSPKYFTTTSKIGAYEGNGGTGVTYYSPVQGAVGSFQAVGTTGNWGDNASSYIQGAPRRNYDNPGITEEYHYMVWGTEAEANAAIAQLPGIDQSYDFDFTKENMLWFNINGPLKKESAGWTFYMNANTDNGVTSYNGQMWSPVRAWNASGVTTVNFDIAVTGTTKLKLIWQKPGLNYDNQYSKEFTVVGDGQFHTVSVFTSDPNFTGIISTLGFGPGSTTGTGAKVVIRRIWKN